MTAQLAALAVVLLSVATAIAVAGAATPAKGNGEPNKAADLVVEACKTMSNDILYAKFPHFDEEPCVSALRSDKRSAVAKDHGDLAMVAFDLLERRIKDTATKIDSILHNFPAHSWPERALQICAANYASMSRTLPVCRDIFLDLKPLGKRAYDDVDAWGALSFMHRLGEAGRDCAMLLENSQYPKSPDEFFDAVKYVGLVWGLIELATGCTTDNSTPW